jgi:DNA topoisomerase-1
MSYILFLVESPHKAETLTHILGKDYKVMATVGHIMDLDPKKMSIEIDNNFKPIYIQNEDKTEVIRKIKDASKKASQIIFAADPDREGEMIAWGTAQILGVKKPIRVTYTEITKSAIIDAIKHPRELDTNLVDAQKTRRMLDRIVGYELSPLVVRLLSIQHLSAGRVQSVVARLIIDKEREIQEFMKKELPAIFKYSGDFLHKKDLMHAVLYNKSDKSTKNAKTTKTSKKESMNDDEQNDEDMSNDEKGIVQITSLNKAKELIENMRKTNFTISGVDEKMSERNPSPPFSTSTMQQASANKLGFTVKRTMTSAQNLYEAGYITYLRTDSVNLSEDALNSIGSYIKKTFGDKYYRRVQYKSKGKNTQEAHEAIRPTNIEKVDNLSGKKIGNDELKLYSLIWKRSVASQMKPAKIKNHIIHIALDNLKNYEFISKTETVEFAGFLKVYNLMDVEQNNTDENISVLKNIPTVGDILNVKEVICKQTYQRPPARYNDGSLVNKLKPENLNIGRPATTQSIITKIQDRGYVIKKDVDGIEKKVISFVLDEKRKVNTHNDIIMYGKETNKFVPTDLGFTVNDFLMKYFPHIMDYQFTSDMEDKLDNIAEGSVKWLKIMKEFYKDFHPNVDDVKKNIKDMVKQNKKVLGKYPTTDEDIIMTLGQYGPIVKTKRDGKYVIAPIQLPLTVETITLKDAIKLLEYPKKVGMYKEKEILLQKGKYGYYLKYDGENISVGETSDISLKGAIEKIVENDNKNLWKGSDDTYLYKILEGQYGKYISAKNKKNRLAKARNIKLPDDVDVKELTLSDVQKLVSEWKPKRKFYKKGSSTVNRTKSVSKTKTFRKKKT